MCSALSVLASSTVDKLHQVCTSKRWHVIGPITVSLSIEGIWGQPSTPRPISLRSKSTSGSEDGFPKVSSSRYVRGPQVSRENAASQAPGNTPRKEGCSDGITYVIKQRSRREWKHTRAHAHTHVRAHPCTPSVPAVLAHTKEYPTPPLPVCGVLEGPGTQEVIKIIPFDMVMHCHSQLLSIVCKITLSDTPFRDCQDSALFPGPVGGQGSLRRAAAQAPGSALSTFLPKAMK